MDDLTFALSERMRAAAWPDRWMTLSEIDAELDDLSFWRRAGLTAWSAEGRRHWLRAALNRRDEDGRSVWLCMGARYKHFDRVRQNRGDVDDYLTWVAETREARTRRAEELLQGQHVVSAVVLHPLAGEPAEYARHADGLTRDLIASVRDEQVAGRLREVWAIYEGAGLNDAGKALHVCRLFCALCTLYVEWRMTGREAVRRAVERAERWLDSRLYCRFEEEDVDEPAAQAG
jgi:hypothetical protein